MQRLLLTLTALCTLSPLLMSHGAGAPQRAQPKQVERGAQLYDANCSVCHGERAGGLEEARLAFPEDHRRCESCHKPRNPDLQAQMTGSFEIVKGASVIGNAFAIGEAPALVGKGALTNFPNAAALHAYLRATMPRYEPGRLTDAEYYAVTAYLLELNGTLLPDTRLTSENALSLSLPRR